MNILVQFFNSGSPRSQLIKKNIFGTFGLKAISMLTSFALVPLTIGYVSNQLYGVWLALSSVLNWIGLFDVGFGNGLRNRLTENLALGNMEKCQQYVSTTYYCLTWIFVPLAILCTAGCGLVNWSSLLNVDPAMNDEILQTVRIVVSFSCVTFIVKNLSMILMALQYNALSSALNTIGQVVSLVVIGLLTLFTKGNLLYLALALTVIPFCVYLVASIYIFKYHYPHLAPRLKMVRKDLIKDILGLGIKFFITQIACLVLYGLMNVLISNVSSPEYVTEYNVVYQYLSLPVLVYGVILSPFWSAYTEAYTLGDYPWMNNLYKKLTKMLFVAYLGVVILIIFNSFFFKIWLGKSVDIHMSMIIAVASYVFIQMFCNLQTSIINGTGCITLQLYGSVVMTVVNIPLALFLGSFLGAEGIIYSVAFLNLVWAVPSYLQVRKILNKTASGIWIK